MREFHLKHIAGCVHSPAQTPLARILLIHGIGEHSGRHQTTIDHLVESGYEVVSFDLRGSGKSGGRRQWVDKFSDYVQDVNLVFNWCQRELEALPIFVMGHSMGGAIAVYFAAERGDLLRGLILSAPAFQVGQAVSPVKIALGRLLVRIVPKLRLPGVDHKAISRDPKVIQAYTEDPLSCHFNTIQQGTEVLDALEHMPEQASHIRCPVLIVHGSSDKIIPLAGSHKLLAKIASHDKSMLILPGGYHEPHNDLDRVIYFNHLTQWIERIRQNA